MRTWADIDLLLTSETITDAMKDNETTYAWLLSISRMSDALAKVVDLNYYDALADWFEVALAERVPLAK